MVRSFECLGNQRYCITICIIFKREKLLNIICAMLVNCLGFQSTDCIDFVVQVFLVMVITCIVLIKKIKGWLKNCCLVLMQ